MDEEWLASNLDQYNEKYSNIPYHRLLTINRVIFNLTLSH